MIAVALSNNFKIVHSAYENTQVLRYKNTTNAFGFDYESAEFENQVRIEVDLQNTSFPVIERIYRQSDGNYRHSNVFIDKRKELFTDQFDDETHEALFVALKHQYVYLDDVLYFCQGEYELEPNEFNGLQRGKAILLEQGFNRTNLSC